MTGMHATACPTTVDHSVVVSSTFTLSVTEQTHNQGWKDPTQVDFIGFFFWGGFISIFKNFKFKENLKVSFLILGFIIFPFLLLNDFVLLQEYLP